MPSYVTVTASQSDISVSWRAPWSLDVTGVDPDIWYSVLIQNVTDENNPTPISCTDCTNITETVYTFTPDHLSPCHVYNFSVTPFNGAGQGESSHNVAGYTYEGKYPMERIEMTTITLISHSRYSSSWSKHCCS